MGSLLSHPEETQQIAPRPKVANTEDKSSGSDTPLSDIQPNKPLKSLSPLITSPSSTSDIPLGFECLVGEPWPRLPTHGFQFFPSRTTLVIKIRFGNKAETVSVSPNSAEKEVLRLIGDPIRVRLLKLGKKHPTNYEFYPHGSDENWDFEGLHPTTLRTQEEEEDIASWVLDGLLAIRDIHRRLRESKKSLEEMGFERMRICWEMPAFMDPEEEGWVEGCWLPAQGPYLSQYEIIESDTVPIGETRVFKVIVAHYPNSMRLLE